MTNVVSLLLINYSTAGHVVFSSEVLCHNPLLSGLPDHVLPGLNRSQHKTNGALMNSNNSVIQLQLYDVITLLAN